MRVASGIIIALDTTCCSLPSQATGTAGPMRCTPPTYGAIMQVSRADRHPAAGNPPGRRPWARAGINRHRNALVAGHSVHPGAGQPAPDAARPLMTAVTHHPRPPGRCGPGHRGVMSALLFGLRCEVLLIGVRALGW